MKVIKRNGKTEDVKFDKILNRVKKATWDLNTSYIDSVKVAQKVINGLFDGVTTTKLDELAAETAASMTTQHPDYSKLAARLAVSSLHKETNKSFSETAEILHNYIEPKTGEKAGLISDEIIEIVRKHADVLDSAIVHDRDYNFDYFGFKTLEKAYLLKINNKPFERPQYMYMRIALQLHKDNIEKVIETYNLLSEQWYSHATPTMFNSATKRPQLASCFLLTTEDSIEGIFKTLSDSAQISKNAGGIGIDFSKVRSKNSYVKGTNGKSNGIIPFLKIFNETARAVDQGGKRAGSIAMYLEPWHADIMEFLDLRKNHGKEEMRARDLFLALWATDLFFERVENDAEWTLFDPNQAPMLTETYGEEFKQYYLEYEKTGKGKVVKARDIWERAISSMIETGTPYILRKDDANIKNNQNNIGLIRSSNLCLNGDTYVKCRINNREVILTMVELDDLFKSGENIEVFSFNEETNEKEWCLVLNSAMTNNNAEMLRITDEETGKFIECTPEHLVFTKNRGYVKAQDLKNDDILLID